MIHAQRLVYICMCRGTSILSPTEKATLATEVKRLYVKYSSTIFFIFYSYFGVLELTILDKGQY